MIEIHGHRGSRGTHPENTIPSFAEARDAGAEYVELDVHLSRDGVAVVHHDPVLSGRHCRGADGQPLARELPIRSLTAKELAAFDCGSIPQAAFPEQKLVLGLRIPTLEALIEWKLREAPRLGLNIEIKRDVDAPGGAPSPAELAGAVHALIARHSLAGPGTLVQSFDHEVVREFRRLDPQTRLSCLFEHAAEFGRVAADCGAQVAAPAHRLVTPEAVARARGLGVGILPWTANEPGDWKRLREAGVHGIITDYPRKLRAFLLTS